LRRSEPDHAVRLQSGVGVSQVAHGDLEPGARLVLALKAAGQGATNADVAEITGRLRQIENFLSACQPGDRSARLCGSIAPGLPRRQLHRRPEELDLRASSGRLGGRRRGA
jgi:hypothetical protein